MTAFGGDAICQLAAQGIGRFCMCPTDYVTDTGMPELRSLMGVQLGFIGVQLGYKVIPGCFAGPAGRQTGTSGNQLATLSSLPDDGAHTPVQQPGPGAQPCPAPPLIVVSAGQMLGLV
jgi:hypothetical protein